MHTQIAYVVLIALIVGCGDSSSDSTDPMPTSTTETADGTSADSADNSDPSTDEANLDEANMEEPSLCNASKAGELCVIVQVPENVPSIPTKVSGKITNALVVEN